MKTKPGDTDRLAAEIEAADDQLEKLEEEIREIGAPASYALRHRLEALKIEEHALQRNFAEAGAHPEETHRTERMRKIEALLHHIEREEASLAHDADFLHGASPSTLEIAFRGGLRLLDPVVRRWKRLVGTRHWMWHSPFVNHTHRDLIRGFGLPRNKR